MFKVLTYNPIAKKGLERLPYGAYEIASEMQSPDAILIRSFNMHDISIPSSLKVVARAGAGVNNIPVNKLTQLGVPVLNTPGANANAVKELVVVGMLLASRHIYQAHTYIQKLGGDTAAMNAQVEKDKKQFVGTELAGKTLGVIGLGHIGVKVANVALALGMQVIGYDPSISVKHAWELSSSVQQAHSIDSLLAKSDFVSLHIPLVNETRHMFNSLRFQALKKGAVLLNFAREEIIDLPALEQALADQIISAYVCDFPIKELQQHPKVVILPHLGASTQEAEENCAVMAAHQIREFLEHGNIINSVNFPNLEMPLNQGIRVAIANANVPNMVAQISAQLGAANINIIDLLNKSRDEIAYTLIDVKGPLPAEVITNIKAITGVLQVRVIDKVTIQ